MSDGSMKREAFEECAGQLQSLTPDEIEFPSEIAGKPIDAVILDPNKRYSRQKRFDHALSILRDVAASLEETAALKEAAALEGAASFEDVAELKEFCSALNDAIAEGEDIDIPT